MTTLKDVQAKIEDIQSEINRLQDETVNTINRTQELQAERDGLLIASEIDGDEKAAKKLIEVDAQISKNGDLGQALLAQIEKTEDQLNLKRAEANVLAGAEGRKVIAVTRKKLDDLADEFGQMLYKQSRLAQEAMLISSEGQSELLEMDEDPAALSYHWFRMSVSPKIVISLGRVSKMNLNSSISGDARDWFAEQERAVITAPSVSIPEPKPKPKVKAKAKTKARTKAKSKA